MTIWQGQLPELPKSFNVELPEIYQIEATSACNYECGMCYRFFGPRQHENSYFSLDLAQKMVDRGDFGGSYFVEFQLSGEPLLHPRLKDLIQIVKQTGVKMGLSTNGSLLHPKAGRLAVRNLVAVCELDAMTISVDGVDEETYELYRPVKDSHRHGTQGPSFTFTAGELFQVIDLVLSQPKHPVLDLQIIELPGWQAQLDKLIDLRHQRGWTKAVNVRTTPDCSIISRGELGPEALADRPHELCLNPWLSVTALSSGKVVSCCLTPGQFVETVSGPKKIEEIVVGDQVLTHKGRFKRVTNVMSHQHRGPVYAIRRKKSGQVLRVTGEHPVLTTDGWVSAEDVTVGDKLKIVMPFNTDCSQEVIRFDLAEFAPKGYVVGSSSIRGTKRCAWDTMPRYVDLTPELARLIGYFLAEGYVTRNGVNFCFHKDEALYHEDVQRLLVEVFHMSSKVTFAKKQKSCEISAANAVLREFFGRTFGTSSITKHLPAEVMQARLDVQKEILAGWVYGDGSWFTTVTAATSSPALGSQMYQMFLRQGLNPSIYVIDPHRGHLSYQIAFQNSEDVKTVYHLLSLADRGANIDRSIGRNQKRHDALYEVGERFVACQVFDVTDEAYDGQVYNLEVAGDESYVVSLWGAVHNCFDFHGLNEYGDLNQNSLAEIWEGRAVKDLRQAHMTGHGLPVLCQTCYMRSPVNIHFKFYRNWQRGGAIYYAPGRESYDGHDKD